MVPRPPHERRAAYDRPVGSIDAVTWQALGLVLTLLGLALSALVWVRRGPARGLRAVAWSLLPLAAGLTGVLRLGWEIADSVLRWSARLVFSPLVWLGLVVAAIALALFLVSGWLLRRAPTERVTAEGGREPAGSLGTGDDAADIEEMLRKHGIQ